MIRKKKKLIAILGLASCNIYAGNAWSFLNQETSESTPLACSMTDYSWYDKSGPDYVHYPKVESQTLVLQADSINGQNKGTHIAQGNVVGYSGNDTISADWLLYDQRNNRITAGDKLVLTRQYDTISGNWADYYLDLNRGAFTKAKVFYKNAHMTGTGQKINVTDQNHTSITNGYFTSCDPNNPAWYVTSNKINLDYQNSSGNARGAVMYFESIPIFASPYLTFPLGQRKSGWLIPMFNSNSTSGFNFSEPYYWNMAPNYDMTITPEVWANQGVMLADEFRYMSESNLGSIYTEQMPSSWANNAYRYYWSLNDTYSPLSQVQTGYKYNVVSDNNYFNSFGNFYAVTDNVNLDQSIFARYNPNWGTANIKLQNYQTLFPPGYSQTVPIYSSYPSINFNVNPQDIGGGIKSGLISNYNYFYSPSMQSGERTILYPSIAYPLQSSWGFVIPKAGFNYTYYSLGSTLTYTGTAGTYQRSLPVVSLDSGLYFDRPADLDNGSYSETFEPRLYYLYIPAVNQANLPLFDTATATYNINQLFSENRFSGFDRVNSANDITIGAATRFLNDATGNELMNWEVGYRYYIAQQNNFIYGNQTQDSQLFLPNPNLITELTNNWSKIISTSSYLQYDSIYNTIDAYRVGVQFNPDDYKVINTSFRYQSQLPLLYYAWQPGQALQQAQYENQYALDFSTQWPIYKNKLFAVGHTNYDFTQRQLLNILGGLEYNGGCWSISTVYEQFLYNINLNQKVYYVQFTFNGLGGVGSNPINDLRINIPGYMPISRPADSYQFQ